MVSSILPLTTPNQEVKRAIEGTDDISSVSRVIEGHQGSNSSMSLACISEFFESSQGRNRILKTLSYVAKLATVVTDSERTNVRLKVFSSQLSECRVMLTLLDDIPILYRTLRYGLGRQEADRLVRAIELTRNVLDLVGNPVGYIAWAARRGIVDLNEEAWDVAAVVLWIFSLKLSLLKSLRRLQVDASSTQTDTHFCVGAVGSASLLTKARENRRAESLMCVRLILELAYAVSYLPVGVLWGGRLKTWQVGALGTLSSIIGVYQMMAKQSTRCTRFNAKRPKHS